MPELNGCEPQEFSPTQKNEIVVYQPDETLRLDVRLENETVWLTQGQMADLFQRDRSVITRHIGNVFSEGELTEGGNVQFLHIPLSDKPIKLYSLNVVISVGYRVKSVRGTQFRIWATSVLRDYLLRGYAVNERLVQIEDRMNRRFAELGQRLDALEDKVEFFVRTQTPPLQGVFYDGQLWDARAFVDRLVKSARKSLLLVDNFSRMPPRDSVAGGIRRFSASLGPSLLRERGRLFPSSRQLVVSSTGRGATRRGHSNPARAGGLPPRARPGFPFRRFPQGPRKEVLRLHEDGRRGNPWPEGAALTPGGDAARPFQPGPRRRAQSPAARGRVSRVRCRVVFKTGQL